MERMMGEYDGMCREAVLNTVEMYRMEQRALAAVIERLRQLAASYEEATNAVMMVRELGTQLYTDTHGGCRLERLDPMGKLYRKCERAFFRLYHPSKERFGGKKMGLVDIYHIHNRVLIDRYDRKAAQFENDEVKGLFKTVPVKNLARVACFGFSSHAGGPEGGDAEIEQILFPFWCKRVNKFDFGTPFPPRQLYRSEVSVVEPGELVVLNRVLVGRSLGKSDPDAEEQDEVFDVFPSVFHANLQAYELKDSDRVLPEFLYILQPIDEELAFAPLLLHQEMTITGTVESLPSPSPSPSSASAPAGTFSLHPGQASSKMPARLRKVVDEATAIDDTSPGDNARVVHFWTWINRAHEKLSQSFYEIRQTLESQRAQVVSGLKAESETARRRLYDYATATDGELVKDALDAVLVDMQQQLRQKSELLRRQQLQTSRLVELLHNKRSALDRLKSRSVNRNRLLEDEDGQ
jgi:hypothetical protein